MSEYAANTGISGTPLVSVALCTYNGSACLREQLDSLINQTYKNLEIVIVDDVSSDNTSGIIKEYRQKDSRITFYQNEKNLGYNKNFEKACLLTTGNYIAIADQDDVWALHKIETMLRQWPQDSVFIYSISKDFFGNSPITGDGKKPIRYYSGSRPEKLVFDSPIHGHACMFRRALLEAAIPFPENVFYDWWLSMVASAINQVDCVPETLTYHRMRGTNYSRELTSIKERKERTDKLRRQSIHHIEEFLKRPYAGEQTRALLEKYVTLLHRKKNNKFSWSLFNFYWKNRSVTFHYKLKRNIFSLIKNSFKKAFTGL